MSKANNNQIGYCTSYITPRRVTGLQRLSPRHCARATHLLLKKRCSGGEPLATLCPIWLARDLNLRPPGSRDESITAQPTGGLEQIMEDVIDSKFRAGHCITRKSETRSYQRYCEYIFDLTCMTGDSTSCTFVQNRTRWLLGYFVGEERFLH